MKKYVSIVLFIVLGVAIVAVAIWYNNKSDEAMQAAEVQSATVAEQAQSQLMQSLKITDVVVGTGTAAEDGDTVTVNYVGTFDNGTKFDSSYDRRAPFTFLLGMNKVIQGWDLGVVGMKVGGTRTLVVPPELGYGANDYPQGSNPPTIPANSTLHFTVELLSVSTSSPTQ